MVFLNVRRVKLAAHRSSRLLKCRGIADGVDENATSFKHGYACPRQENAQEATQ